jgi:hypothetical protein
MDIKDAQQLYRQRVNIDLPLAAKEKRLPIRLNHCFGRVILDNIFKGNWRDFLDGESKMPAYKQLSLDQLETALQLAQMMLDLQREYTVLLNNRSLAYRGKPTR